MKAEEKLFIAMYNPMIYESSFGIISIHTTKKGAEMAMEFHRNEEKEKWLELYPTQKEQKEYPFGTFEAWKVFEYEVFD